MALPMVLPYGGVERRTSWPDKRRQRVLLFSSGGAARAYQGPLQQL
jgi:hypothetical protein